MSEKRTLLIGTFILTATGFASRLIGFFFRIFLSHTFGEEQVGLYQLIFPIYALCISLTCAGIETAVSRCTARRVSLGKKEETLQFLYVGLGLSLFLSFLVMLTLQAHAADFSIYVLGDVRCESLLTVLSYAVPFASIHSCICGYYLGLKQTRIPALSQLVEQIVRVGAVFIIHRIACYHSGQDSILSAVLGIAAGECAAALFCVRVLTRSPKAFRIRHFLPRIPGLLRELLRLSVPLTSSRILLNILQSVESISIPLRLARHGCSASEALRNYGVLTGMALPCILFPSAVTNSVSTMLLPAVAEIQATQNFSKLKQVVSKVFFSCFTLGLTCCLGFLLSASFLGNVLFHSELACRYLRTLAWICPFLYLNATLTSVTNGLGKANAAFLISALGLTVRITGVLVFIPRIGMNGYLWGLLLSQVLTTLLSVLHLAAYFKKRIPSL